MFVISEYDARSYANPMMNDNALSVNMDKNNLYVYRSQADYLTCNSPRGPGLLSAVNGNCMLACPLPPSSSFFSFDLGCGLPLTLFVLCRGTLGHHLALQRFVSFCFLSSFLRPLSPSFLLISSSLLFSLFSQAT
jgi:hypothetical protein